ncbi:V-set and immunoglobulin domain-containing protein 10 isoform X2 [Takifugu flavidus]|uniref:V-set and immunoglobulin domain-containing protein 10 isoform X2 n=1 Tax=Takifugu flavidus TaxID=433684 RepID=UPI00254480E8|nr:V-set and immunoglobulin domain-containing protein 10 isoform X2 [Takifugu flavidus]
MILAALSFLHACLWTTAALSGEGSSDATLTVSPGDIVLLPCSSAGGLAPRSTTWARNGRELIRGGGPEQGALPGGERLSLLPDGTLNIAEVTPGDEGSYLCNATLQDNSTFLAQVRLRVTSDPGNLTTSISPASALSNGTLFVSRGSDVSFNCSTSSGSSRELAWAFRGAAASNGSLVSTSGPWLVFRIAAIQPGDQGLYVCSSLDNVTQQGVEASSELLVYYVSDRHPECMWTPVQDPSHALFNCTWPGTYPTPRLSWVEHREDRTYASEVTDNLSLLLNRSSLSDGQKLTCVARHVALAPETGKSCTLTIRPPFPEGEPLAMAQEGDSITLTCTEATSAPPANTTWRKGLQQEDVTPGLKYALSEDGPALRLTIRNVSKDDEGVYFCRSENLLGVRELEVYLTVRTSSAYTGVIIGIFVAAVIVASPIVLAKSLYSNRHRVCLGRGVRQEDGGDVMNLVESDDEPVFQDAVPRLPPLTNGHQTTLVQIHRIPSSDQEDPEGPDPSPVQQEDTVETEEPESLVTF